MQGESGGASGPGGAGAGGLARAAVAESSSARSRIMGLGQPPHGLSSAVKLCKPAAPRALPQQARACVRGTTNRGRGGRSPGRRRGGAVGRAAARPVGNSVQLESTASRARPADRDPRQPRQLQPAASARRPRARMKLADGRLGRCGVCRCGQRALDSPALNGRGRGRCRRVFQVVRVRLLRGRGETGDRREAQALQQVQAGPVLQPRVPEVSARPCSQSAPAPDRLATH